MKNARQIVRVGIMAVAVATIRRMRYGNEKSFAERGHGCYVRDREDLCQL